jgi:hypothetical protein
MNQPTLILHHDAQDPQHAYEAWTDAFSDIHGFGPTKEAAIQAYKQHLRVYIARLNHALSGIALGTIAHKEIGGHKL